MVTKKSITEAHESLRAWRKENPNASLKDSLKRNARYIKEAYEVDIRVGAIPSMIVPMPKSAVLRLESRLKRR